MIKKVIIALAFFMHAHSFAQIVSDYQYFVAPMNLSWNTSKLPADVLNSKAYANWRKKILDENPPLKWAYAHITNKTQPEIIIQEQVGGTGGLTTVVMKKRGGNWSELVQIFGGFIFFNTPSASNTLIVYERSGANYENVELKLVGDKYQLISKREVPLEVSQRNSQNDMFNFFWFMVKGTYMP